MRQFNAQRQNKNTLHVYVYDSTIRFLGSVAWKKSLFSREKNMAVLQWPRWRCLAIMHNTMLGENQTKHYAVMRGVGGGEIWVCLGVIERGKTCHWVNNKINVQPSVQQIKAGQIGPLLQEHNPKHTSSDELNPMKMLWQVLKNDTHTLMLNVVQHVRIDYVGKWLHIKM